MSGDITQAVQRWRQGDVSAQYDLERWLRPIPFNEAQVTAT